MGNIPKVSHLLIFVLFFKPMNIFKALLLVPQLIYQAEALYDFVTQLDDDPTVKAAFDRFKNDPAIAMNYASIKAQAMALKNIVDQLKKLF